MPVSVKCRAVVRRGGKLYVRFTDKVELEFESVADMRRYVRAALDDDEATRETLRLLLLAKWLKGDAGGATPATLEGQTITLDLDLPANIVRVT